MKLKRVYLLTSLPLQIEYLFPFGRLDMKEGTLESFAQSLFLVPHSFVTARRIDQLALAM